MAMSDGVRKWITTAGLLVFGVIAGVTLTNIWMSSQSSAVVKEAIGGEIKALTKVAVRTTMTHFSYSNTFLF